MLDVLKKAAISLGVLTILTGLLYPLAVTACAQVLFHEKANGSLVKKEGQVIGSALIGQKFAGDRYFHGRQSHAGEDGYDAANSSGSCYGPTNKDMKATIQERVDQVRKDYGLPTDAKVPSHLVTASSSGLDPHISPEAAFFQVKRVALARGMEEADVKKLVQQHCEAKQFGILGIEKVNVLQLNLALDEQ